MCITLGQTLTRVVFDFEEVCEEVSEDSGQPSIDAILPRIRNYRIKDQLQLEASEWGEWSFWSKQVTLQLCQCICVSV